MILCNPICCRLKATRIPNLLQLSSEQNKTCLRQVSPGPWQWTCEAVTGQIQFTQLHQQVHIGRDSPKLIQACKFMFTFITAGGAYQIQLHRLGYTVKIAFIQMHKVKLSETGDSLGSCDDAMLVSQL